jgi:hypothetical protein
MSTPRNHQFPGYPNTPHPNTPHPNTPWFQCCTVCGVVRRADGTNKPCTASMGETWQTGAGIPERPFPQPYEHHYEGGRRL